MREIEAGGHLPVPLDEVWEAVLSPEVLRAVAAPVFVLRPVAPSALPARWAAGDYRLGLWLFGVIPFGWQIVGARFPEAEPPARVFVDAGRSPVFSTWEHRITLTPEAGGTRLAERLRFEAGVLGAPAALALRLFLRYRLWRLGRLLARQR